MVSNTEQKHRDDSGFARTSNMQGGQSPDRSFLDGVVPQLLTDDQARQQWILKVAELRAQQPG